MLVQMDLVAVGVGMHIVASSKGDKAGKSEESQDKVRVIFRCNEVDVNTSWHVKTVPNDSMFDSYVS
jgi:hypothetical protein